ncbi:MAG: amidohydrolase family protein, partial [Prevotella sp.]|nr:amidohydrolase family protein [Prevotella sp.]
MMTIIDAHSHLWLKQDTSWNGKEIRSLKNGRSIFLGEEVQMIPPFIIDSVNSAEVFLSNMDYAQVTAAVVVQELIDGNQNDYLIDVAQRYPDRFIVCGMFDYFGNNIVEEVRALIDRGFKGIAIPGHRLITDDRRVMLNSPEMIAAFKLMEEKDV